MISSLLSRKENFGRITKVKVTIRAIKEMRKINVTRSGIFPLII